MVVGAAGLNHKGVAGLNLRALDKRRFHANSVVEDRDAMVEFVLREYRILEKEELNGAVTER